MNALNDPATDVSGRQADAEEGSEIDLRELIAVFVGSWPLVVACTLLALGVGRYLIFVTPPTYRTDALIQVETSPNAAQVAIGQITQSVAPGLPRDTEIALLRSRNVMGSVVDRLSIDVEAVPSHLILFGQQVGAAVARHHRSPEFGQPPVWLRPFAEPGLAWGGERIEVSTFEVPEELVGRRFELVKAADSSAYTLRFRDEVLGKGQIGEPLRIPAASLDSDSARDVELFVRRLEARPGTIFHLRKIPRERAIAQLQRGFTTRAGSAPGILTLQFTGQSPEEIARELTAILQSYQSQNLERRSEQAEKTLAFLSEQMPTLRDRLESAEARLNQFRIERGSADLDQTTSAILDRNLALEQQRTELIQRRDEALQRFTDAHPVVVSLNTQIERMGARLSEVDDQVAELPTIQREALALQREVQLATSLYTSLLNRRQEIEMVRAGTTGSIRIIDPPLVPKRSIAPNASRISALAGAGGLAVGLGLIFTIFLLRTGVEDPTKVEKRLGLPTYGSIPWSTLQQRIARKIDGIRGGQEQILAEIEPDSVTIEAVRSLRTALRFAQFDAPDNITMLTSPVPGVGKSFVSANLGALMARAGDRVVIVDADLRRGYLNKVFGFERHPGLSELISGDASLDEAVRKTDLDGLYLLSTGTRPPNPSEMVMTEEFVNCLRELSQHFDQVIVDTPPILAVTDAADIGRHCGTTLLVLKAGSHPLRMIDDTVKRLRRAGVRVRGTVFNQVGKQRSTYYGYGYYDSYYTGYQYAYKGSPTARWKRRLERLLRGRRSNRPA